LGHDGHEVRLVGEGGDQRRRQGRWRKAGFGVGFGGRYGLKGINEVKLCLG